MIGLLRRLYVHLEHYNRPYLGDYNAACFNNCLRLDFEYRRSENATEASDASQEASDDNDYLNLEKVVKFLEGLSHSGPRQWNFVRVPSRDRHLCYGGNVVVTDLTADSEHSVAVCAVEPDKQDGPLNFDTNSVSTSFFTLREGLTPTSTPTEYTCSNNR